MHYHIVELRFRGLDLAVVGRVNHIDYCVSISVVGVPCRSQIFLATKVPHLQLQIFVLNFLYIAAHSGLGDHDLIKGQLVKDCGLAGIVHADNYNLVLLVNLADGLQLVNQF